MVVQRKSNQFRAMFLKNATFLKRQKCSMCLQISIPLVLVVMLCIIQIFVKKQLSQMQTVLVTPAEADFDTFGVFDVCNPNSIADLGESTPFANGTGFLGLTPQFLDTYSKPPVATPYSVEYKTQSEMFDAILSYKTEIISDRRKSFHIPWKKLNDMAFAGITFYKLDNETLELEYQLAIETQRIFQISNVSDPGNYIFTMNLLSTAYMNYFFNNEILLVGGAIPMPYYQAPPALDMGSLLGSLFYPFALSFLLPLYVFSIVIEKQERLRDMCLMYGLKMRNYWICTYIFDLLLYACALVIVVGISLAFGFSVFTQTSGFAMFLMLFGWGNAQITFSFFLSTLFKRTRTATIVSYFLIIISVVVNLILGYQVFQNEAPPQPYYWYPPFAFYRGFSIISALCGLDMCPKSLSDFNWAYEPTRCIVWLYLDSLFFLVLSLYLDQVIPREFGVPKHPLFPFIAIRDYFKGQDTKKKSEKDREYLSDTQSLLDIQETEEEKEPLDEDVQYEKDLIKDKKYEKDDTNIIIKGLSKHYPGRDKPALDNLYLTIKKGEILGLLGANGAGKTTTISLLTGLYTPTSGTALVCGLDIRTHMDDIHRFVSVCPQFDVLWDDLDCVETLLFYARLKGVEKSKELTEVDETLKQVNLLQFKERLVKELSGGMRRRLSIAISIIGDSNIIFLDEITTGLDVQEKRRLWGIVNNLKQNRSIILTTHSIEEADVLSSRIAIMSQGKLKCLGNQQHLKQKYGEGYTLKINIDQKHVGLVDPTQLILKFSPNAKLEESLSGYYCYRLEKDILISELFKFMQQYQSEYHITEFSINQSSLEDVFLKILENDETVA